MSLADWDGELARNLRPAFLIGKAMANELIRTKQKGNIAYVASISGLQSAALHAAYGSAKAGLRSLVQTMALELGPHGIRVNAVAPGPIWTPLVVMSFPASKNAQFGSDTPLGRPGQPGELAPLYVFLATDDSRYISGEVIGATGGKPLH